MSRHSPVSPALVVRTLAAWAVTLLLFFPLGWLFLTAFKTELQAISVPPLLFFTPTLENFHEVQERSDYLHYAWNSVVTSVVSTLLGLAIAAPAAYSMAFTVSVGGLRLPQNLASSTLDLSMAAPGSLMLGPQASSVTVPLRPMMS